MARQKRRSLVTEEQMKHLFSINLRKRLVEVDMGQIELAKRMDRERASISRWCNGRVSPNFETIAALCTELNVQPSYFMRESSAL